MPDWFYRTVTQPVLFRLPAEGARDFALGFMGRLVRLPFGPKVIDFLGHMGADPRLRRSFLGIDFPSPLGLGPGLDGRAVALPALSRFGFGFLEVGPITVEETPSGGPLERRAEREAIASPDPPPSLSLAAAAPRLAEASSLGLPVIARLGYAAGEPPEKAARDTGRLIAELAPHADLFSLAALRAALAEGWSRDRWRIYLGSVLGAAQAASAPRPVLLCVPADLEEEAAPLVEDAVAAGLAGLLVDGSVAGEAASRLSGLPAREPALEQVRRWRSRYERELLLIAGGGVHEPADALALLAAGADLVQTDSGIVFTGPGLPKRINDALLFAETRAAPPVPAPRAPEMTWFWTALLGAGMLFGSLLALAIAATRVVLPYDEAFLGMSRQEIAALNPRLLAFMAHDRVSLAGTMAAIGVLYLGLSLSGIRRGLHWAQQSVFVSACTGFASFFLFLGFGYLDTFHAFVTAALLQLLLMGIHSRLGIYTPEVPAPLVGDRVWKRSLWGQLLLVIHGFTLLGAGVAISAIGITGVFVAEDLEFMQTTAEALAGAHPRLVPLVAHDRATLGGMLLAVGWGFLLPALWGFRTGSRWLWWSLLLAGLFGYGGALAIHFGVGYTDWLHLLPAFGGLGLLLLGLGLSRSYLCRGGPPGS